MKKFEAGANKGPLPDSYRVAPRQPIAGEYPGARDPAAAKRKLAGLLDAGVRSFLDPTERDELEPYELTPQRLASSRVIEVHMRTILERARGEIADGPPIYAHYRGGIGRPGTVVGCWMTRDGHLTADHPIA